MSTSFCINIGLWESCFRNGCLILSQWARNPNVSMNLTAVFSCFDKIGQFIMVCSNGQHLDPPLHSRSTTENATCTWQDHSARILGSVYEEKSVPWPRQCTVAQVDEKVHQLPIELLFLSPYSPDLCSSEFYMVADFIKCEKGSGTEIAIL